MNLAKLLSFIIAVIIFSFALNLVSCSEEEIDPAFDFYIPDVFPPQLVKSECIPFDGGMANLGTEKFILIFDEKIKDKNGNATFSLNGDNEMFTIDSIHRYTVELAIIGELVHDTDYTLTITGIEDREGNEMHSDTISFHYDGVLPTLEKDLCVPVNEALITDVYPAQITLEFSEEIKPIDDSVVFDVEGSSEDFDLTVESQEGSTLVLNIYGDYTDGTVYTLNISGIQDLAGNIIADDTLIFTVDLEPPYLIKELSYPPESGYLYNSTSYMMLYFNENVEDINSDAVFSCDCGGVTATIDYIEDNRVYLTPSGALPASACVLSVSGMDDIAENIMTADTINFTAGAAITFDYNTHVFGTTEFESANQIKQTFDGGFIIAGRTTSVDRNGDIYLVKTDHNGTLVWEQIIGYYGNDQANAVVQAPDGGYYVTGWTSSFSSNGGIDAFILKTDYLGAQEWIEIYGGEESDGAYDICEDANGGYTIVGWTTSFSEAEDYDIYVVNVDADGNINWENNFGGTDSEQAYSIIRASDDGFVVAGYTTSFGEGNRDVIIVKTLSNGNEHWKHTYGGTEWDQGTSVAATSDGGYIITGYTQSYGAGISDIYLIKTDQLGIVVWETYYGDFYNEQGWSVIEASDGNFVVVGFTENYSAASYDMLILKADASDGTLLWDPPHIFGGADDDRARYVQETTDGGFIIAGFTYSAGAGQNDISIVKTNDAGNL